MPPLQDSVQETHYNQEHIRNYYNAYGEREWERMLSSPANQVSFHIHKHYLHKYIASNNSVLELGAGAGRFSIELAQLTDNLTVTDLSPEQLRLAKQHMAKAGFQAQAFLEQDITNLSDFQNESFDVVTCYGGPLSYVLEQATTAFEEMLRVTKHNGYILLSVMSLLGTTRTYYEAISALEAFPDIVDNVNSEGILTGETNNGHILKMYRYKELKELIEQFPCQIVAASASNYLSLGLDRAALLEQQHKNSEIWNRFLQWELDYCAELGALDNGTHIIVVVKKDAL